MKTYYLMFIVLSICLGFIGCGVLTVTNSSSTDFGDVFWEDSEDKRYYFENETNELSIGSEESQSVKTGNSPIHFYIKGSHIRNETVADIEIDRFERRTFILNDATLVVTSLTTGEEVLRIKDIKVKINK